MRELASSAYRKLVRPFMPRIDGIQNDVRVPDAYRLGDYRITAEKPVEPGYEEVLVQMCESFIKPGEDVVVVGGGYGVVSTYCSNLVEENGSVTVFEASDEMLNYCRETLELNTNYNNWELIEAVFYSDDCVWGDTSSLTEILKGDDIPYCSTLLLDCEGYENLLIQDLEQKPYRIIVETHEKLGTPRDEILKLLESEGYEVKACRVDSFEHGTDIVVAESNRGVSS